MFNPFKAVWGYYQLFMFKRRIGRSIFPDPAPEEYVLEALRKAQKERELQERNPQT